MKSAKVPRFVISAALLALLTVSASSAVAPPPPVVFDADPTHPIFAGDLAVGAARPAERIQLLFAIHAQATVAANDAATSALASFLRETLPGMPVTPDATTVVDNKFLQVGGGPYGGFVRVDVPGRIDDAELRALVNRVMIAIGQLDWKDPVSSTKIVSVGRWYATCVPFETLGSSAAAQRARTLAGALGVPSAASSVHVQPHNWVPIDGPAFDRPLCGSDTRAERPTTVELPTSATFVVRHIYDFAQPIHFSLIRPVAGARSVADFWSEIPHGPYLRLRSKYPLLTVEGHATIEHGRARIFYEYRGPNECYFRRAIAEDQLAEIRERLRALGIPDVAIVTQLDPGSGTWYVSVSTKVETPQDAVVTAIAGTNATERRAVHAAAYTDDCKSTPAAIARALADAAARAQRIGALLGTTVDITHPVAVTLEHGEPQSGCADGGRAAHPAFTEPIAKHVAGSLRTPLNSYQARASDVSVRASFPFEDHDLGGPLASVPASDAEGSYMARFGFIPPRIEYPQASHTGEARRERKLAPQRVQLTLQLDPDNANAFRPIDPHFPAALAAQLGAADAQYTAAFVPSLMGNGPNGEPKPDGLQFVAVVPYQGKRSVEAANAAQRSLYNVGNGGFYIVPQRDDCRDTADLLARDTIRAAAAQARVPPHARLVAIDLRGPFVVDGACHSGPGGAPSWNIRTVTIPQVRLTAYARVSYAR